VRFQELKRRSLLPLAVLGLGAYYLLVYVPLGRRADALDAPLQRAWKKLTTSLEQSNAVAIDFLHITNQLAETRQALGLFEDAKQKAAARLELGMAVRAKINAPFQLVDYEDERSKQVDELVRLAKQHQASIEPRVFAGFPEHTADIKQPALLWGGLAFVNELLTTALQCKVSAIHSLDVPLALTNVPSADDTEMLTEIPLRVELTGSFASVASLLQSLPLRAEEIRAAGLPESPADKPPLFIDRLIIKKQSPEKPDEVRVSLRAIGFVPREKQP